MQSFPLRSFPFSKNTRRRSTSSALQSSSNDRSGEYDSNEDRIDPSSSGKQPEGQDLTEQFYQFIQNNPNNDGSDSGPGRSNLLNTNGGVSPPQQQRKFTGTSSNSFLFNNDDIDKFLDSSATNSNNNRNNPDSNLQREYRREFDLAGRFERTFQYQALAVLAALVVVLTVGITGGITDGSNRYFDDEIDDYNNIEFYYPNNALLQQSWEDYLQDQPRLSGSSSVFL
jgi:hypothetical protein